MRGSEEAEEAGDDAEGIGSVGGNFDGWVVGVEGR